MTMNTDNLSEREAIEKLLPWYVTGKLDEADRKRVDAYLARHPETYERLELSRAELRETAFLNEPLSTPTEENVEQFMAQLGPRNLRAEPPAGKLRTTETGPLDWIRHNLIEPLISPGWAQVGALAAALIILAQAAAIGVLMTSPEPGSVYRTASGDTQAIMPGTYVDVRFVEEARASDIAAALVELNMTIAGGPKAGGFFMVRIGEKGMDDARVARQIAALREKTNLVILVTRAR